MAQDANMDQKANMAQEAQKEKPNTPREVELRTLGDHGDRKSLAYYKKLLESLKEFESTHFKELNDKVEKANSNTKGKMKSRDNHSSKKRRDEADYRRILVRTWGELKGYGMRTPLPDKEEDITKKDLIADYYNEFKGHDDRSPLEIASSIERKCAAIKKRKTTTNSVLSANYVFCYEFKAYEAYLTETLEASELARFKALYERAEKELPGVLKVARETQEASARDKRKKVHDNDGKRKEPASPASAHTGPTKRVRGSPPGNESDIAETTHEDDVVMSPHYFSDEYDPDYFNDEEF